MIYIHDILHNHIYYKVVCKYVFCIYIKLYITYVTLYITGYT